jgi:dolichyl-phosphate beta-glucosyltransferase
MSSPARPDLTVVVPAYNEARRIIPTLASMTVALEGWSYEILVSDDGSKDDTVAIVRRCNLPHVRVLVADRNKGKGAAVQAGMLAATGSRVLLTDADLSTPISELNKLWAKLDGGADIAIGSRAELDSDEMHKSLVRTIVSSGSRFAVRRFLGLRVKDSQCGFKLFDTERCRPIFERQTIDGFSFDVEVLYLAQQQGLEIAEVPVAWFDAPDSKVKPFKVAKRFAVDLMGIKLRYIRGAYNVVSA